VHVSGKVGRARLQGAERGGQGRVRAASRHARLLETPCCPATAPPAPTPTSPTPPPPPPPLPPPHPQPPPTQRSTPSTTSTPSTWSSRSPTWGRLRSAWSASRRVRLLPTLRGAGGCQRVSGRASWGAERTHLSLLLNTAKPLFLALALQARSRPRRRRSWRWRRRPSTRSSSRWGRREAGAAGPRRPCRWPRSRPLPRRRSTTPDAPHPASPSSSPPAARGGSRRARSGAFGRRAPVCEEPGPADAQAAHLCRQCGGGRSGEPGGQQRARAGAAAGAWGGLKWLVSQSKSRRGGRRAQLKGRSLRGDQLPPFALVPGPPRRCASALPRRAPRWWSLAPRCGAGALGLAQAAAVLGNPCNHQR
jgi:hypothetical protein